MRIAVNKRIGDYVAYLVGRPEFTGSGESIEFAIGDLVRTHASRFHLKIVLEPSLAAHEKTPKNDTERSS